MSIALFPSGMVFETSQEITGEVMARFCDLSGDANPMHTDRDYAIKAGFAGPIAYGNLLGLLLSTLVGMKLPTSAVLIVRQSMDFRSPIYVGETVLLKATVASVHESVGTVSLDLRFAVAERRVATGTCVVKCL